MNRQQAIAKCNKKAWREIQIISNAHTMMDVETAIAYACFKTFGFWDMGLQEINAKRQGLDSELAFHNAITFRIMDRSKHTETVIHYLADKIPVRLHSTIMYQSLLNRICHEQRT